MNTFTRALVVALAAALVFPPGVQTAFAAAWTSSDRWGTWSSGGYPLRNNVWGRGSNAVFPFLCTHGWRGDVTVGEIQFGYEITSSSGGKDFTTNSYSVSGG